MLRNVASKAFQAVKPSQTGARAVRAFSSDSGETKQLENVDTFKCINKVTLLGRATGPAFVNQMNNTDMASFVLATNEIRRNKSNELVKRSEFHRVQVFIPRLVSKTKNVVEKGSRILVEGKINYNVRKDDSGNTYFTNIIADNIVFFTGNREAREDSTSEIPEDTQAASN